MSLVDQYDLRSTDSIVNMIKILTKQKNGLKICHINAQSLKNKVDELRSIFENSLVDIISISETWLNSNSSDSSISLHGYKVFRADRVTHGGGVAIYVKNEISCKINCKSGNNDLVEYIFIEIFSNGDKLLFGSVYRPNRRISFEDFFAKLEVISTPFTKIVIAGDFNSNILINTNITESMMALGLFPVNTQIPTHFTSTSSSLIDLFFVSTEARQIFYDQISASCFSKHDLIYMVCDYSLHTTPEKITYRDFKNIDYDLLLEEFFKVDWNITYHLMSIDEQLAFLERNINTLFDKTVALKSRKIGAQNREWFSSYIRHLIEKRELAYSRWKRFRTLSLHDEYRAARKLVNVKIKEAKRNFYSEKFSSALSTKSTWKTIREIGIGKMQRNIDHEEINPDELNHKFVNVNFSQADYTYYERPLFENSHEFLFNFQGITQDDVVLNFLSISSNAIGADNIHPTFLKILLPQLLPLITFIFNKILTSSYYPCRWKQARIIPIPKSNNEYRPIAILPFLSKVFERILHGQIFTFMNSSNLLTEKQSGFRAGHSCLTALTDVIEEIRSRIDYGHVSLLALLDHSKAFDTVDHIILLQKLVKIMRFSPNSLNLIRSYLCGRSQYVDVRGVLSANLMVERGVPQGSILGPLLFSLYVNDLPTIIRKCNVRMYADDIQLFISCANDSVSNCITELNEDLDAVYQWAKINGLELNPRKSKCLMIRKGKRPIDCTSNILINGEPVEVVKCAKNLGIIFNSSLSWADHINMACGKTFSMLRSLWTTQYCTPLRIRMLLARTYLVPALTYGCEIFGNCDAQSKRKLNSTFNAITRYVYNLKKFDHISPFSSIILNVKLDNFFKIRCLIFLHKLITNREPKYLYDRLKFGTSLRSRLIIQFRHTSLISERQYFISAIRLWNDLPIDIRSINNIAQFKRMIFNFYKQTL